MKYSTSILAALALSATQVAAFPAVMYDMMERAEREGNLKQIAEAIEKNLKEKRVLGVAPGFDAAKQYISNKGAHAFVPPNLAAGDQRGPCPGLNALSNHK